VAVTESILIEAGGSVHKLETRFATLIAEHLRAHPDPRAPDACVSAADKLERALVEDQRVPLSFDENERVWVARALEGPRTGNPEDNELRALFWALIGHVPGAETASGA
jgi:hypothetical protein